MKNLYENVDGMRRLLNKLSEEFTEEDYERTDIPKELVNFDSVGGYISQGFFEIDYMEATNGSVLSDEQLKYIKDNYMREVFDGVKAVFSSISSGNIETKEHPDQQKYKW